MRLTTKSRYGTRLLLDLALYGGDTSVPLREISRRQNISLKYLEHLTTKLKKDGLIVSQRGPRGGHRLARSPGEITMGDIVRSLEGTTALTECAESQEDCPNVCDKAGDCLSRRVWVEASKAMFACLDKITLESLISGQHAASAKSSKAAK
jgi:Rrf2 family transcriptional regulator, iron-sulfur cluster assembly transcription factor